LRPAKNKQRVATQPTKRADNLERHLPVREDSPSRSPVRECGFVDPERHDREADPPGAEVESPCKSAAAGFSDDAVMPLTRRLLIPPSIARAIPENVVGVSGVQTLAPSACGWALWSPAMQTGKAPFPGPFSGGACRARTGDLRLAKPALSQLS
jgi:hypothetical protein